MRGVLGFVWIAVLSSREVPRGRPIGVRMLGMDLGLWRDDSGRVRDMIDDCPHWRVRLSISKVGDAQFSTTV